MGDPFRGDLEAAHAKIAQLEEERAELNAQLRNAEGDLARARLAAVTRAPDAARARAPKAAVAAVLTAAATAALLAAVAVIFLARGTARRPVAPPASAVAAPCNCSEGDPLCSCARPFDRGGAAAALGLSTSAAATASASAAPSARPTRR